ncbi:peptidoglycan recognition protein [Diachasma alloeum]|uniref:peptidoglycan recognition protein n=1 Tax=Diachasma alloeum TaxID=454923 RepID=UPI000738385F|nr:peptidoglycan recognition protein [Diachasma alloeum]
MWIIFPCLIILSNIILNSPASATDCPAIVARAQWQARPSRDDNFLITPIPYVFIHHTVTPGCQTFVACTERLRNIQDYHMDDLNWHDIGFSFFIGGDGNVYEGAGWNKEGAHTYGYNKKSLGIAFIGSYQRENATQQMVDAAHKLIACGKEKSMLRPDVKVLGASQVTSTVSPGRKLYQQIQGWPEWSS